MWIDDLRTKVKPELRNRVEKEIELSRQYVKDFDHGTAGHLAYTVIALLADLLDERDEHKPA